VRRQGLGDLEQWRRQRLREEILAEAPRAIARLRARRWPGAGVDPVRIERRLGSKLMSCWMLDAGSHLNEAGDVVDRRIVFAADGGFGVERDRTAGLEHLSSGSLERVLVALQDLG